jgi:hypothetical protein
MARTARSLAFAFLLLLPVLPACHAEGSVKESEPQRITLRVYSGRPQPPAETLSVRVGVPIVVQTEGLGPPQVIVEGPDRARVPTAEAPSVRDGSSSGVEQRFTLVAAGTYRVVLAEAPTIVLALLAAR